MLQAERATMKTCPEPGGAGGTAGGGTWAAEVSQTFGRGMHSGRTILGTLSSPTHLQVSAPAHLGFTTSRLSLPCPEETRPQEGWAREERGQGMANAPVAEVQTMR